MLWILRKIEAEINRMANTMLLRNIDFIHCSPELGQWKLNFRAILFFPGRLPAWKVKWVADRSETEALTFWPSSREGEAKIDRVAERPARQTLRDFLILNCFGVGHKLILYFSAVIEISQKNSRLFPGCIFKFPVISRFAWHPGYNLNFGFFLNFVSAESNF